MMVKICGITNREDALAAVEGGAAALGFNFYPQSPRYLKPELAADIAAHLPGEVWKVGVFVNDPAEHVLETARRAGMDVVQLHGDAGTPEGFRVWKAMSAGEDFDPTRIEAVAAEAVLLDTPSATIHGGTGQSFDWSLAAGVRQKIILAGGLDAENVRKAIATARPWGVDACSRLEAAPGRKDRGKMLGFLKAALSC